MGTPLPRSGAAPGHVWVLPRLPPSCWDCAGLLEVEPGHIHPTKGVRALRGTSPGQDVEVMCCWTELLLSDRTAAPGAVNILSET